MNQMMTVKEASKLWSLTERRVAGLCKNGEIKGAVKEGKAWLIPSDAEKPIDKRIKTGNYSTKPTRSFNLPLPIGISDYRVASSEYYYIDKTIMMDILKFAPVVVMINILLRMIS